MVADINLGGARETAAALRSVATHPDFRAEAVRMDVSQEDSVMGALSRTVGLFGRVDYCVHSAGVSCFPVSALARDSSERWLWGANVGDLLCSPTPARSPEGRPTPSRRPASPTSSACSRSTCTGPSS